MKAGFRRTFRLHHLPPDAKMPASPQLSEHAVDMVSGTVMAVTPLGGTEADTRSIYHMLEAAARAAAELGIEAAEEEGVQGEEKTHNLWTVPRVVAAPNLGAARRTMKYSNGFKARQIQRMAGPEGIPAGALAEAT